MTYPSGRVVDFAYPTGSTNSTSRLASVADGTTTTTLLDSIAFNAAGGVTSQTLNPGANAVAQTFTYNNRLQLTDIEASKGGTALMDFSYDYGTSSTNTGRVLKRTDAIQPEHSAGYAYDSLYRLAQATGADSSWAISWALDTWGNRTGQTPSGLATTRVGSQSIAYTNNKNQSHTYDASGNTTNDGVASSATTRQILENLDMKFSEYMSRFLNGKIKGVVDSKVISTGTVRDALNTSTGRKVLVQGFYQKAR